MRLVLQSDGNIYCGKEVKEHTKMWIIPGTEDLQPYINAKDRIVKWISGTVGMAVFATVIAGVMTLIAR